MKQSWFILYVILLCAIVMLYTGVLIVRDLLEYAEGNASYDALAKQVARSGESAGSVSAPAAMPGRSEAGSHAPASRGDAAQPKVAAPPPSPTPTYPPIPEAIAGSNYDFQALTEANPDIAAWIVSPGTVIDYPVVQGQDNSYYLTHLYDGRENANGTLFIDCDNRPDFADDNTILYGHHMKSGKMFASLEGYKKQSYYDAHPCVYLFTADGTYELQLFAGIVCNGEQGPLPKRFADAADMLQTIEKWREASTFSSDTPVMEGDRLVSLATCTYDYDNARYFLIGKLVKIGVWTSSDPVSR